ncbi:post-GPI attachment to proteins factor 6-like isoform X3 [Leptopilina heterotoma]|uniref:post-GPI attachment to proteins factor 6-like isoform X3 n=1 Tax=Leptopilina heterotoma TaxID=63436 RepID=UPI001CA7F82E|nr:post-GPI attachment to proteins factor 6-like isoform X3 [Leptopilina heterotoma]
MISCFLSVLFNTFFLLFVIKCVKSVEPQASQEGSLHSFKNYVDVAMFHYSVPKEVLRATWQFAAFMDGKECPSRQVHIYLQWGSYPVISERNATFPPHVVPDRNHTFSMSTWTTFEPKVVTVIPVYSPLPGDWFVGAYLSHWDEKVQQQGLGHKCRYSIGSVALWNQMGDIQNIPLGYQKTMKTSEAISYYKIFIPSGTWHFQVQIWGCNFIRKTDNDMRIPCILGLALEARVLPVFNHTHLSSIGNLTNSDTYTFTELSPYEDSYYYLLVISNTTITFNVEVITSDCPVKVIDKSIVKTLLSATYLPKESLTELYVDNFNKNRTHSFDGDEQKNLLQPTALTLHKDEGIEPEDSCIPRFQLARVKHPQTFSNVYLLQGQEWLTSWIILTDDYPVITQFDILPNVDIGGILVINIHLEVEKLVTEQSIEVIICIRQGRKPMRVKGKITCDEKKLMLNLSSYGKHNDSIMIPYPMPDTWYIAFQAKCSSNGQPVRCEMEQILVCLNVKTTQCVPVDNHPCGEHGVCQETYKDLLAYASCSCFGGYKGWGCTDATDVSFESSVLLMTLLLTLSNAFFLPAIVLAIKRKLYTEGLVYLFTMMFSTFYHACDQQFLTYCIAKYEVLQFSDFFSSILSFWVTLVSMAQLPTRFLSVCHMFGALIIAFTVESNRTGLISILIPLGIGVLLPTWSYIYGCIKSRKCKKPRSTWKFVVGLLLACIGVFLFSLVETKDNYSYVHSAWHMLIALSLLFLLPPARKEVNPSNSSDSVSSSDSELLDHQISQNIPTFSVLSSHENLVTSLRKFDTSIHLSLSKISRSGLCWNF